MSLFISQVSSQSIWKTRAEAIKEKGCRVIVMLMCDKPLLRSLRYQRTTQKSKRKRKPYSRLCWRRGSHPFCKDTAAWKCVLLPPQAWGGVGTGGGRGEYVQVSDLKKQSKLGSEMEDNKKMSIEASLVLCTAVLTHMRKQDVWPRAYPRGH